MLATREVGLITDPHELTEMVAKARKQGFRIGFVPTMGALHQGHLELVKRARTSCDLVICSIFVNPLQFNDLTDLKNYPRQLDQDSQLLSSVGCDLLFAPEKEALLSDLQPVEYDLGGIDAHWEGPSRPGHFQGVVNVVERLFFHARPDEAFFGEKDRQQLTILKYVAAVLHWPEHIVACPTIRESDGLAMSSRNMRLDPVGRKEAAILYKALLCVKENAFRSTIAELESQVQALLATTQRVQLEHFGIAHPDTLAPMQDWQGCDEAIALIAAKVGPVRLIDNMTVYRDGSRSIGAS